MRKLIIYVLENRQILVKQNLYGSTGQNNNGYITNTYKKIMYIICIYWKSSWLLRGSFILWQNKNTIHTIIWDLHLIWVNFVASNWAMSKEQCNWNDKMIAHFLSFHLIRMNRKDWLSVLVFQHTNLGSWNTLSDGGLTDCQAL